MSKFKINKELIFQYLNKKITIFDGEKSILYTFNETATYILNQLKKGSTQSDIITLLIKKYKISQIRAQKDTQDIIKDFLKKKIVVKD
jgi:hypothetical protein